jgi:peroxiredoxin
VILKVAIKDKVEDLKKYQRDFNIPFLLLIDEDGQTASLYGVSSHPETFLINREGKIVGRALGDRDWAARSVKRLIELLLKEER